MVKRLSLREKAHALLVNRPASLTIPQIADDLKVSESWLRTFANNGIENPGVVTIEALISYIEAYQAKVAL